MNQNKFNDVISQHPLISYIFISHKNLEFSHAFTHKNYFLSKSNLVSFIDFIVNYKTSLHRQILMRGVNNYQNKMVLVFVQLIINFVVQMHTKLPHICRIYTHT